MKSIPFALVALCLAFWVSPSSGEQPHQPLESFPIGCEDKEANEPVPLQKIKSIEIPGVNFFETPLNEVLNTLSAYSRQNDFSEPDPAAKGVLIIAMLKGQPVPKVTIQLNKMTLERMLDFTTEMIGLNYEVREDAIVVSKGLRGGGSPSLKVEFFPLSQGIIQRMTGSAVAGAPKSAGPVDPFGSDPKKGPGHQASLVKQYLINAGIQFDEEKGQKFIFDGFQMILTHDQEALDRIRGILLELDQDVTQQINVEFKILEAPLGALDKAMEKALGEDRLNVTQAIQIESRLAEKAFLELKTAEGVEVRSLPRFVTMDGQPASLKIGEEMIYPTDFTSPNPAVAPTAGTKPLANTPVPQFDTVAPDDEKPGFRMVGISIDLTPRYEPKYDRINLEMAPQITEFKGYEEFGAGIKVPRFWSWTLNTSVNLRRNHSMIFRGPASEKKREIIIFLQANAFR